MFTAIMLALCLSVGIISGAGPAPVSEAAESVWVRIEKEGVYVLRSPTNSTDERLFLAEYTYFLRVVGQTNLYYQVMLYDNFDGYYSVSGFVRKDEVSLCGESPSLPLYPKASATVKAGSSLMYADPDPEAEVLVVALRNQEVCYYGLLEGYLYCRLGDKLGYISTESLTLPEIQLHPKPIKNSPTEQTSSPPRSEESQGGNLDIPSALTPLAVIIPLAVILPVLAVSILFDSRRKAAERGERGNRKR